MAKTTTFTAPNGKTRKSRANYTHALALFNPKEPWTEPWVKSFHGSVELAEIAVKHLVKQGYRYLVVPVTTDGSKDPVEAQRIIDLRTQADLDNIPAMKIAEAEAELAHHKKCLEEAQADYRLGNTGPFTTEADLLRYVESASRSVQKAEDELVRVRAEWAPQETEPEQVAETPKPKKIRRAPAKSRFVSEVAQLITDAPHDGDLSEILSTGHEAIVTREDGRYTSLVIKGDHGNRFEFRCPFGADQARKIATQIWDLMQTMGL